MEYRAESIEEHAKNIEALQSRDAQLREKRQNLRLLDFKQKKEANKKIEQTEQDLSQAQDYFKNRFHIDHAQVPEELKRLQDEFAQEKLN